LENDGFLLAGCVEGENPENSPAVFRVVEGDPINNAGKGFLDYTGMFIEKSLHENDFISSWTAV
jgi:hypothetical protein